MEIYIVIAAKESNKLFQEFTRFISNSGEGEGGGGREVWYVCLTGMCLFAGYRFRLFFWNGYQKKAIL